MFEFGRVCERRKLIANVSKNKVMGCSRYVNVVRQDVRLNDVPLVELDCLTYLGSKWQEMEDAKKSLYELVIIVPTAFHRAAA